MQRKTIWIVVIVLFAVLPQVAFPADDLNDVSSGMRMEDALFVAKMCVIQASSFKDPRNRKIKELRPEDTLEFAGVGDEFRLSALRRYIIRNRQIGVQSIWADPFGTGLQPYLISRSELADIKKDWTIAKLALAIAENAGIAVLPLSKAKSIVSECRYEATGSSAASVSVSSQIVSDLGGNLGKFKACLLDSSGPSADSHYVLKKAGVTDPEGDSYVYHLHNTSVIDSAISSGTYRDLIAKLQKNGRVEFSAYLTAIGIVVRSITKVKFGNSCSETSFQISKLCNQFEISETTKLGDLGIDLGDLANTIRSTDGRFRQRKGGEKSYANQINISLSPETELWQLIEKVEETLEKIS